MSTPSTPGQHRSARGGIRVAVIGASIALLLFVGLVGPGPRERRMYGWGLQLRPDLRGAAVAMIESRDAARLARQEYEIIDSRARARSAATRGGAGLSVIAGPGIGAELRESAAAAARRELAALPGMGAAHAVTLILAIDTLAPHSMMYRRAVVLPAQPGEACTVILRFRSERARWPNGRPGERVLGTCGFFAAYGMPGEGMAKWLRASGMRTAQFAVALGGFVDEDRIDARNARTWPALAACRAGALDSCEAIFDGRTTTDAWVFRGVWDENGPEESDVSVGAQFWGSLPADRLTRGVLAELARELGPERFALLWRDVRGPHAALEGMTGRSPAQWMADVVAEEVEPYKRGPAVPPVPFAATVLVIGGMGAWSVWGAKRRMT